MRQPWWDIRLHRARTLQQHKLCIQLLLVPLLVACASIAITTCGQSIKMKNSAYILAGGEGGGAPMAPMDVENQKTFAFAERSVRHGFVRKVFGIVAVQLVSCLQLSVMLARSDEGQLRFVDLIVECHIIQNRGPALWLQT